MKLRTDGLMPYEALRNAIVVQAAEDYRKAVRKIRRAEKRIASFEAELEKLRAEQMPEANAADKVLLGKCAAELENKSEVQRKNIDAAGRDIVQIEKFFLSGWYRSICSVDGKLILTELRREAEDVKG